MTALASPWTVRAVVLAVLVVLPFTLGSFSLSLLTEILIFGLLAASLDLLMGYTGLPSLGHAAFFGVGGYTAALVATRLTDNAFAALAAATALAGVAAVVIGALAVRSRGIYLLMLTLATAQLLFSLAESWTSVTGGSNGITGIPPITLLPGGGAVTDGVLFYFYVLAAFLVAYAFLRLVTRSPFGRALVGIRENPERMESLGYPVGLYKLASFAIAGAAAGYAGTLFVQHARFISPAAISFVVSILVVVMVIIGGTGTLYGSILGAGVVLLLRDELSTRFEHWELALGLAFVLFVYFLPRGIGGAVRAVGLRVAPRPRAAPAAAAPHEKAGV